jgi:hypothetical protein
MVTGYNPMYNLSELVSSACPPMVLQHIRYAVLKFSKNKAFSLILSSEPATNMIK